MQKTAYCVRIRVWSSDVCSSDLRFDHVDLLEPAQQRAVLFEVIAELLVRRRADAADHAAREGRLEQVRRIHRAAARRARTDDRVDFVDEQDRVRQPFELGHDLFRSEEHTSELQSLMRISYAVFCLKKTTQLRQTH